MSWACVRGDCSSSERCVVSQRSILTQNVGRRMVGQKQRRERIDELPGRQLEWAVVAAAIGEGQGGGRKFTMASSGIIKNS